MSLSRTSSVDIVLDPYSPVTPPKLPAQPTAAKPTPADHIDPNHPHNGDIGSQVPVSPRRFISKRMAWILFSTTLFLATLGVAFGLGVLYGEKHPAIGPAPEPAYVTLQPWEASTTTEVSVVMVTMVPDSEEPPVGPMPTS
jgi:hypothetical protein